MPGWRCRTEPLPIRNDTQAKIQDANANYFTHENDKISIVDVGRRRIRGKGGDKVWSSEAILRASFGPSIFRPVQNLNHSRGRVFGAKRRARMGIISNRSAAEFMHASHSYLLQVRNAVAMYILSRQLAYIRANTHQRIRHRIRVVGVDETESEVHLHGEVGVHSLCMMHVTGVDRFENSSVRRYEIVMPPAYLADIRAETIGAAIDERMGMLPTDCQTTQEVYVLCSDSAPTLVKRAELSKHRAAVHPQPRHPPMTLHCRCMMHMMFAAMVAVMRPFKITSNMFCATVLLHKGTNMGMIRESVRRSLVSIVDVVYAVPEGVDIVANRRHNEAIINLLNVVDREFYIDDPDNIDDDDRLGAHSKRVEARRGLLDACIGKWGVDERCLFLARLGDGVARAADAAKEVLRLMEGAWFGIRPPIPAINRWNKVYWPLMWFWAGTVFYNVVPDAFATVKERMTVELQKASTNIDVLALVGREFFQVFRAVRWRRAGVWLNDPITQRGAGVIGVLFGPVLRYMGRNFKGTRAGKDAAILKYCCATTSPCDATLRELIAMLTDESHPAWRPLLGNGWTQSLRQICGNTALALMGNLTMRCGILWGEWPFEAGKLVHPHVSADEKRHVARNLYAIGSCCPTRTDGFTWPFRCRAGTPDDFFLMPNLELLSDLFAETADGEPLHGASANCWGLGNRESNSKFNAIVGHTDNSTMARRSQPSAG